MARIEKRTHRGKLTPYASHRQHGGTTPVTMSGRRHDAERSLGIVGVTEPTLPGTPPRPSLPGGWPVLCTRSAPETRAGG